MTPKERAAMQLALKAMEDASPYGLTFKEAIAACGEVLAEQAEQEPVAWAHPSGGHLSARYMKEFATGLEKETHTIPLYAAPVRTKDLTDDEIAAIVRKAAIGYAINRDGLTSHRIARAVIAAFKEKNK